MKTREELVQAAEGIVPLNHRLTVYEVVDVMADFALKEIDLAVTDRDAQWTGAVNEMSMSILKNALEGK